MRNILLIITLSLLIAIPTFARIERTGDNYTKTDKRHPYLKDTEIYYMTSEGERKEAEFDLYVLDKPIKDCKVCVSKKDGLKRNNNELCEDKNPYVKYIPCYPKYVDIFNSFFEFSKARLTISKVLRRIDNCTILPFMFDTAVEYRSERELGCIIKPHVYGRYDDLKAGAIRDMHHNLLFLAKTYSLTKINKCGSYPDLRVGKLNNGFRLDRVQLDHLTE